MMTKTLDPRGPLSAMAAAERRRVADLIRRTQLDRQREMDRQCAELEVLEGNFVNLSDTVMEPTPEWLEKAETVPFTPRLLAGTVKTQRTVRRVDRALVIRMHDAGSLTDEQLAACLWYRTTHEVAGMDGRVKTSKFSSSPSGAGGGDGQNPMPLHEHEAIARVSFREAREAMPQAVLRFFDAVVLEDLALRRASRFARCPERRAKNLFRLTCNALVVHLQAKGEAKEGPNHGG